jgi:hypothetical protein
LSANPPSAYCRVHFRAVGESVAQVVSDPASWHPVWRVGDVAACADGALSMVCIDSRESHVRLWLMMAVLGAVTLLGIDLPLMEC